MRLALRFDLLQVFVWLTCLALFIGLLAGLPRWYPSLEDRAATLAPGATPAEVREALGEPHAVLADGSWRYGPGNRHSGWALGASFDEAGRLEQLQWVTLTTNGRWQKSPIDLGE